MIAIAREFADLGFGIIATSGTADMLAAAGIAVTKLFKLAEGRPNVLDLIKNGQIQFIINTPSGKIPREDEVKIRTAALTERIPIMTTIRAAYGEREGHSLPAKRRADRAQPAGISRRRQGKRGSA